VSFAVRAGEIVGIAGRLGSGRTELLLALFGARPADRGRLFVRTGGGDGGPGDPALGCAARARGDADESVAKASFAGAGGRAASEESRLEAAEATPARMRRLGVALVPEDRKTQGLVPGMSRPTCMA